MIFKGQNAPAHDGQRVEVKVKVVKKFTLMGGPPPLYLINIVNPAHWWPFIILFSSQLSILEKITTCFVGVYMGCPYTSFTLLVEIYRAAIQGLCAKGYKPRNMQQQNKMGFRKEYWKSVVLV